ncbi:MAG TPA: cysteine desulfurase family protein, partial [Thermoanaerobaculia bacterium]|nr:cysteine desulfurase family protein [Thermoanaerobaculia bacterium]
MQPVYLDHNATTPLHPWARAAMLPWLAERWGNPSSRHAFGQAARGAVEEAREEVAALLGARSPEVVFTASGTEANNAVFEHVGARAGYRGQVVVSALEHPSVREGAARLARRGMRVAVVSPGGDGIVPAAAVVEALAEDTRLVCLMLAHNELGTLQPVAELARACRERGVPVLCDAVQAAGKVPVDVGELEIDYLTLGAHKLYGPLGAAALWVRKGAELDGLLLGGGQERRRRAGTENVPALVGLGAAAAAARAEGEARGARLAALRDRFECGLGRIPGAEVHCAGAPRLPNTSHVGFPGADGEALFIRLDLSGFAVSTGAACASGAVEPSHTLLAAGFSREVALSSLRVSFGITNTEEEVDAFLDVLAREVEEVRGLIGMID